jgi:hypothetical protein
MILSFPNRSRSFEPKHDRVRFWGHASAIEITFFLEGKALRKLCPGLGADEASVLSAFDSMVSKIHGAAKTAFDSARYQSGTFVLTEHAF